VSNFHLPKPEERRKPAMPSFACKDLGMKCDWKVTGKTEGEIMPKIAEHAAKVHNMKTIPPDMMEKVKKAIKK
jgi:predicted small metal-binding protein